MASATINFEVKRTVYLSLVILASKLFGIKGYNKACKMLKNKVAAKIYSDNKLNGKITINELFNN